jgi:hypothetical protein
MGNTVEFVAPRRGNPHLRSVRNLQGLHKIDTVGNREEWPSFPVRVIGDDGTLKRKGRNNGNSSRKK